MQTHSLQTVPSLESEMVSISADVSAGSAVASARNAVARRSSLRRVTRRSIAKNNRNANTDIAGSEIGSPPQTFVRKTDE